MSDLKPIETRYKGYRFRSRLEARWAVFFDFMAVDWEYEPQGFKLPSRLYLPDFYFPDWDCYAEVRATQERHDDELLAELAQHTLKPVIGLVGVPAIAWYPFLNALDFIPPEMRDEPDEIPVFRDWVNLGDSVEIGRLSIAANYPGGNVYPPAHTELYVGAVNAARGARFEHGETPTL